MEEEIPKAQKLLQEFDAEEGRLDLLAVSVPSGENRKIRDEIKDLAGEQATVIFQNIEADAIRAQIIPGQQSDTIGATEEMVRRFENEGWMWG